MPLLVYFFWAQGQIMLANRTHSFPNIYNNMDRQNKNNRSLLAMAGENSIASSNSKRSVQPYASNYKHTNKEVSMFPTSLNLQSKSILFDPKSVVKKLGLARLRKMQALVRGFLVRRTIYPKQLTKYLIAKSAMDLIIANVIYRQVSGIVVQSVTLGHYDQKEAGGQDRMLEEYLYNAIIKKVIEKQFMPIARQAVYQTAIYASRPQITFGFNMRDPLELILFAKINSIIQSQSRQIAEESLRQQALQRRQLQIIDDLITRMGVIPSICQQVVNQCLLEGVEEYVLQQIIKKVTKEGALVVGEVVYNQKLAEIEELHVNQLVQQAQEWLLQQCILSFIVPKPSKQILPAELHSPDKINQ